MKSAKNLRDQKEATRSQQKNHTSAVSTYSHVENEPFTQKVWRGLPIHTMIVESSKNIKLS